MMRTVVFTAVITLVITLVTAMPAMADGQEVYDEYCAACHLPDGAGMSGLAPGLKSDLWKRLGAGAPDYLAAVMLNGMAGLTLDGQMYSNVMPPWDYLNDEDLLAISDYILVDLNGLSDGMTADVLVETREDGSLSPAALKALREGG